MIALLLTILCILLIVLEVYIVLRIRKLHKRKAVIPTRIMTTYYAIAVILPLVSIYLTTLIF